MVRLENPAIHLYLVPVLFDIPNMLWFMKNRSRQEGMAAGREAGVLHDVSGTGAGPVDEPGPVDEQVTTALPGADSGCQRSFSALSKRYAANRWQP